VRGTVAVATPPRYARRQGARGKGQGARGKGQGADTLTSFWILSDTLMSSWTDVVKAFHN
jgi:hypothetical protein